MTEKEQRLKDMCKELLGLLRKKDEQIQILQGALNEAVRIFSINPPGDMDHYNGGMLWALVGSRDNPEKWMQYLLGTSMDKLGIAPKNNETEE